MCFSLDSVPDEQLTLGEAWMDGSDNPLELKHFDRRKVRTFSHHLIRLLPSRQELSVFVPGARRTVCGSVSLHLP